VKEGKKREEMKSIDKRKRTSEVRGRRWRGRESEKGLGRKRVRVRVRERVRVCEREAEIVDNLHH
jgi:hypothetical protein